MQEHNKSEVHKLTCNTCKLAYIGQTSINLKQRYQEHIWNNDPQSAYAQHIIKNQHEYGPITDAVTLLESEQKNLRVNPLQTAMHPNLPPQWTPHS